MKKIVSGILSFLLVGSLVAGAAYALFSDSVTMNGMVLGTATPGLDMSLNGVNFYPEFNNLGNLFAPLLPGETDWGEFYLRNTSNGTTDKVDMTLSARLTSAGGDWGTLKDAVLLRICKYNSIPA